MQQENLQKLSRAPVEGAWHKATRGLSVISGLDHWNGLLYSVTLNNHEFHYRHAETLLSQCMHLLVSYTLITVYVPSTLAEVILVVTTYTTGNYISAWRLN